MNKLFSFIVTKIEDRTLLILRKAIAEATLEVNAMFADWWDGGPNIVADAGARRLLRDEEYSEIDVAVMVDITRYTAFNLAVDARAQVAMSNALAKFIPTAGGFRQEFITLMSQNNDEMTVAMRHSVASFGINPEALEAHFTH